MRNQTDEKHSFGAENSNAELPAKEGHCSDSLKFGANLMPLLLTKQYIRFSRECRHMLRWKL